MDWEERVDGCFWTAVEAQQRGRFEEALTAQSEAETLLRAHLSPVRHSKLAALLYGKAAILLTAADVACQIEAAMGKADRTAPEADRTAPEQPSGAGDPAAVRPHPAAVSGESGTPRPAPAVPPSTPHPALVRPVAPPTPQAAPVVRLAAPEGAVPLPSGEASPAVNPAVRGARRLGLGGVLRRFLGGR